MASVMFATLPMPDAHSVIYLATNNAHKVAEILRSVALFGSSIRFENAKKLGGMPEVDETGSTLAENARLKALALHEKARAASKWVCADDTGLFVEALGGSPGIHTARYAGPEGNAEKNIAKLVAAMKGLPPKKRHAEFRCCLLVLSPEGKEYIFEGIFRGRIADERAGCGGFGYDPVFIPDGYEKTVAELEEDTKNRISHRALAVKALLDGLPIKHRNAIIHA